MRPIDIDFGEDVFEKLIKPLKPGQALTAGTVLTVLDNEGDIDAFQEMDILNVPLDISDLPKAAGLGEAAVRLRQEEQLVKEGRLLSGFEENDPLRLHLEEIASIPACGDIAVLEQELKKTVLQEREDPELYQKLLNLSLSRIVEIACEYTGYGVLLLDLIQEGSMGLWQYLPRLCGDDFEKMRDYVVRHVMKKMLIVQAHANGVGQKMRQAMEDYRSVDEKLLTELGRNPTVEEIAEDLHMTAETAASVAGMIEAARMVSRAKAEPEPDPREEEQAVEDTAYFQMRQRIQELLTSLSEADAKLLTLRFGLEGGLPMSPEEVGRKLGLTPGEVVQREQAALAVLRNQKN